MRERIGWHGFALFALGVWALTRGVAYLPRFEPRDIPLGISLLIEGAPITLTTYAVAWLAASAAAFVGGFMRRKFWAFLIVLALASMASMAFTLSFLYSVVERHPSRDWLTAGSYIGPAGALFALAMISRGGGRKKPST